MSIVVAHGRRRHEILEHALDVFIDEGYENTTFQKIADRCGITRTTLYIYFKNRQDIFVYSIKQFQQGLETAIRAVSADTGKDYPAKLAAIICGTIDRLTANPRLVHVIYDYLTFISKHGDDPDEQVRHRTVRVRHFLASLLIDGMRAGQIREIRVRDAVEMLYSFIESAVFRLEGLHRTKMDDLKNAVIFAVQQLAVKAENGGKHE